MIEYTIIPMTLDHYDEVYRLWKSHDGIGLSGADSRENIGRFLERNVGMSFVAVRDGRIIGAILGGHDGRRGYVHHLIVEADCRSWGAGKELVERCLERFRELGIQKSHVFVFRDNSDGIGFWKKIGFAPRDDLFIMSKDIQGRYP